MYRVKVTTDANLFQEEDMFEDIKLYTQRTFSRSTKDKPKRLNRVRENTKKTEDDFTRFVEYRTSKRIEVPMINKKHEAPKNNELEETEVPVQALGYQSTNEWKNTRRHPRYAESQAISKK